MLAKRIIPCLDVNHRRVVKGKKFHNLQDVDDPVTLENTTPNPARTSSFSMTSLPLTKDARPSSIPSVPSQKSSPSPSR